MTHKDYLYNCNPQVKALHNRGVARGHTTCHKKKKASNMMMRSQINTFLASLNAFSLATENPFASILGQNSKS